MAKLYAQDLGANDRIETSRSAHMRPRQELHETEIETETKQIGLETITFLGTSVGNDWKCWPM